MIRRVAPFALLAPLAALAACGANTKPPESLAGYFGPEPGGGSVLGDQGLVFGVGKGVNRQRDQGGGSLGVNAYLWRGALDTLSFMPLASADPFGGTIITDWYSPPGTPDERFKATAFILGRELRSDGLRVTVFRQVLRDGRWEDAPVSSVTTADIENKILDRARAMRANMVASQ